MITYTVLCGYQPFQGEDNMELMDDIIHARYEFHERYWKNVSPDGNYWLIALQAIILNLQCFVARAFIRSCLALNPKDRPTATEALNHVWMTGKQAKDIDLLDTMRENFNARRTFKSAISAVKAINRIRSHSLVKEGKRESTSSIVTNTTNISS